MRVDEQNLVESLTLLSHVENPQQVAEALEGVRYEDIAEAFLRMEFDEQLSLLQQLDSEVAGNVLVELPSQTARNLLAEVPDEVAAHYLDILPVDDCLELIDVLGEERFEALLEVIPALDALEIRQHLSYPENSAGQLMSLDFLAVNPTDTMDVVLSKIREAPDVVETVNYIYVLRDREILSGVLTLRRVLRADANALAESVMNSDVISVNVLADQEDVARMMARYGFTAMPVLDMQGRMVGLVTADDAQEVLTEADTEDVLALGAVTGDAESYLSLSTWELVKRRLPWLTILFIAETLTGHVMRHYIPNESVSEGGQLAVIAKLTLFIPLLIGAGGNSGSQVTTTITRALAVGEVKTSDYFRVLRRETVTALVIGAVLGLLGFTRALFGWNAGLDISLVVGVALPSIIIWATLISSGLPLAAKKIGIDPAVMSAPFISTFVDATGLIIYFEIAGRILGLKY